MKKAILVIIFACLFLPVYAQDKYQLKTQVYSLGQNTPISHLFLDGEKITALNGVSFKPAFGKKIYSHMDISGELFKKGLSDFVLVGTQVELNCYQNITKIPELMASLAAQENGQSVDWNKNPPPGLPEKFVLTSCQLKPMNEEIEAEIQLIDFTTAAGQPAKIVWKAAVSLMQNSNTMTQSPVILKKTKTMAAELIYQNGALTISTPVFIRRELEKGVYLVENKTSGKIMRVRAEEQNGQGLK